MLWLLNPRVIFALALVALLSFTHFTAYRSGKQVIRAEWQAAQVEQEREAQAQAQRIRELQRAAETRYTVQAGVREEFIGYTIREGHHAAAPIASCALPADLVRLLNSAATCARSDTATACSIDQPLPVSR